MKLCKDVDLLKKILSGQVIQAWGEIDGYDHKERKDGVRSSLVNQASRALVRAMRPCYLVKVNRYQKTDPFMVEYRRGMVFNFAASFAIKEKDEELLSLLEERDAAPYTGTTDDARRVDAIFDRMESLKGQSLHWY